MNVLKNSEPANAWVTVPVQEGIDQSGLIIDSCYRVINRKQNGDAGNKLKFAVNLFHTTSKMNINGSRVDIFINDIFDKICEVIQDELGDIEILNKSMQCYLLQLKNYYSSDIIQRTTEKIESQTTNIIIDPTE